ncbi:hypothetical protein BBI10_04915 [Pseudomonas graminis]|uniref:Uncharacterized protein n=1 Tax=Pseudomonas graminis TaxID=158627 RepID=A0A1C2ECK3_9PSED|nr:hypothetical protein BBI10_04915 [Pseudomonas graminis]
MKIKSRSKASRLKPVLLIHRVQSVMIVPTLRVGMPLRTLRVPQTTHIQAVEVTQSVTGYIPTRSVGTIRYL